MTTNKVALGLVVALALTGCGKKDANGSAATDGMDPTSAAVAAELAKKQADLEKMGAANKAVADKVMATAGDARAKADADMKAATAAASSQRDALAAGADKALAGLKARINGLNAKGAALSPMAKPAFELLMQSVDTQWAAAFKGLSDLKGAPEDLVGEQNTALTATLKKLNDAVAAAAAKVGG